MPQSFTFQFGPVTVTVDGVPDSVLPAALTCDLSVFDHYADPDERIPRFVETFRAMGGAEAFGVDSATTERNAVRLEAKSDEDERTRGEFLLYLASASRKPKPHPALEAALAAESAA